MHRLAHNDLPAGEKLNVDIRFYSALDFTDEL